MIADADLVSLRAKSEVVYSELDHASEEELNDLCLGVDYLMLNYDVAKKLSRNFYKQPSIAALRHISFDMTGMDWASPEAAIQQQISISHVPHYSTQSVAESILCEVLLHTRQRHLAYVDETNGREVQARSGMNVFGRTVGVVGLGSIGTRVYEIFSALGANVIAWNRSEREGRELSTLQDLFTEADIICIALKTVEEGPNANVEIVNAELLNRCRGSIIVNLANQALVDNVAMATALGAGNVSGYSVERTEAVLQSSLPSIESVHLCATNAWASDESLAKLREVWVGNVIAAIDGRSQNLVSD